MIKFFRVLFALIICLTVAIGTFRLIGNILQLGSNALLRIMFATPYNSHPDKPCMFGLCPDTVKNSSDTQRLAQFSWFNDVRLSNGYLSGWFDIAGKDTEFGASIGYVGYVSLNHANQGRFTPQTISFLQPTLGDIFIRFGSPTFVHWQDGSLAIWYKDIHLFIGSIKAPNTPLTPYDPIDEMTFFSPEIPRSGIFTAENRWRGFITKPR